MFAKKITDILLEGNMISAQRRLDISRIALENLLKGSEYSYSGSGLQKDNDAENALLPPFIVAFYYCIFYKLRVPTERELIKEYYELNGFEIENDFVSVGNKKISGKGIEARLLRSYPSFIRDFHFYLLLTESSYFEKVSYSLKTDYLAGLDLKIVFKNRQFHLSVFVNTSRGKSYKTKKQNRHDYSEINEIELGVDFDTMKKHGDFYLLDDSHLEKLISKLGSYDNRK